MDVPSTKSKRRVAVSFDVDSDSSSEEGDIPGDQIFNKYSSTPPSRQNIKGVLKKRTPPKISVTGNSHSKSLIHGESKQQPDVMRIKSPSFKWHHREISKQRDSERAMKRVTSDVGLPTFYGEVTASDESLSSSSDDESSSNTALPSEGHRNQRLKVESRSRFMSLCSQLIKLPRIARANRKFDALQSKQLMSQKCRADFQQYFSDLMKVRNTDQQTLGVCNDESQEKNEDETLWQNEFKDLLWLELQAWISERSPREQDEYLLIQRQRIPEVLDRIMGYKFEPFKGSKPVVSNEVKQEATKVECSGCLDAFCGDCALNQSKALYEVSKLLKELEGVEELYPSGRAFAVDYPLYGSTAFIDRVKAMCLWYNISCLLQLKIDIIGHMLVSLGSKGLPWPTWPAWPPPVEEASSSSIEEPKPRSPEELADETASSVPIAPGSKQKKILKREKSRVQFFVENGSEQVTCHHPAEDSPGESWRSEYSGSDLPESDVSLKNTFLAELPSDKSENNQSDKTPESSNSDGDSETSIKEEGFEKADGRLLYRSYVEKALKNKGLRQMVRWIVIIHRVSMTRAKEALRKPDQYQSDNSSSSPYSSYTEEYEVLAGPSMDIPQYADLQRYGAWSPEYKELNLPQYRTLYFFLCRIPLDVIRESLCIRLEQKPAEPSTLSIRQLMQEFKEGMKVGVLCKHKYRKDVRAVLPSDNEGDLPHSALEKEFGETLKLTLNVYLDYLKRWVTMGAPTCVQKNVLEMEWSFTRSVCSAIPNGEMLAGNAFCSIASSILHAPVKYLRDGIEQVELHAELHDSSQSSSGDRPEKNIALRILRQIQYVVQEARDQCVKAVSITKMIRRDLEVAAEFDIQIPSVELLERLTSTGLVRVVIPNSDKYAVFVPRFLRDRKDWLQCLLDLSARSDPLKLSMLDEVDPESKYSPSSENDAENEGYMILLQTQAEDGLDLDVTNLWKGETIYVSVLKDDSIFRSHLQPRVLLLVVFNSFYLADRRRELHELLGPGLELRNENKPSGYVVPGSILQLKDEINILSQTIIDAIQEVENRFKDIRSLDPLDQAPLLSRWQEVVRTCYKLGFEFHKDVIRIVSGKPDNQLALNVIHLARKWMNFTMAHCERGRGRRPKWAAQGLDFLVTVCEMEITSCLSDEEFHKLKEVIGSVVCHIIGTADNAHPPVTGTSLSLGSLKSPTSPDVRKFKRYSTSYFPNSTSSNGLSSLPSPLSSRKPKSFNSSREDLLSPEGTQQPDFDYKTLPWKQRIQQSISVIESEHDSRMEEANLIGHVSRQVKEAKWHIRLKSVNFSWQRGVKIGQGRFGKVYVAVNNKTGELMAMKEIALQPGDHRTVRNIADELRIFEGIHHPHLVHYYGVEIHREEMIIFMEFCPEGTLKNLAASTDNGLPEELIRRFTRQLLEAVQILHQNGIVHRDIKGDNIFLTNGGNSLKLGDFGCAAKIKQQTTMQGELQGFVGTQAFMAPEVFMHSLGEGHGRAADIWSVGCVIVEMGTGKRPWFELESNYAIMFKVGMGEIPPTPSNLSEEGQEFLSHLLQHDPKLRSTADQLLEHNFLKVYQEDDPDFNKR